MGFEGENVSSSSVLDKHGGTRVTPAPGRLREENQVQQLVLLQSWRLACMM